MQLTATLPITMRRPRERHRSAPRRAARPAVTGAQASARRGSPSEDWALYSCHCGCAFKAAVTTSVGCPHCGTAQAW